MSKGPWKRLTFSAVKLTLRLEYHMTIERREDEFRVNFLHGYEPTAYYTMDLRDALRTGIEMRQALREPILGATYVHL